MKILMCIDDTDNLESIGTGELLENLCRELDESSLASAGFVSRHQLFVHEDIPYTSHNSSMCVSLECAQKQLDGILGFAKEYLEANSAEGSDPGLCVVDPEELMLEGKESLIAFGMRAKKEILTKECAYEFAQSHENAIYLSEHGGTGGGIIGALAGCGLRMYGSDGRLKGKVRPLDPQEVRKAGEFCTHYGLGRILTEKFEPVGLEELVESAVEIKAILWNHEPVVLVEPNTGERADWKIISKNGLNKKRIGR